MRRVHLTAAVALALAAVTVTAQGADKKKKPTKKDSTSEPAAGAGAGVSAGVTVEAPRATVTTPTVEAKTTVVAAPSATVETSGPAAVEVVEGGGERADRPGFSIAGLIGFDVVSGGYTGFAVGARAGYTLPFHLYIGGGLTFYVASFSVISIAPEIGYDIGIGQKMVVRPYAGIGFVDVPAAGAAAFELYPGGEFLYHITRNFFVGGDARIPLLFVANATGAGFNLMGTVGYKF